MANEEISSLLNRLWVAGRLLFRDPVPIHILPKRFESKMRTSNLGMRKDSVFIAEGFPNVMNRIDLQLAWRDVREPTLLEHLTSLANMGQAFDVALFKQDADFFDGDGASTTFVLQRRVIGPAFYTANPTVQFPIVLKATRYSAPYGTIGATETDYTTIVYTTEALINTGTPAAGEVWIAEDGHAQGNLLVTTVRVNPAPASGYDTLRITYAPLMRMFVDVDSGRTYAEALQMSRGFTFTEQ